MCSIPFFPLTSDRFQHHVGIRALAPDEPLLQQTDSFGGELELKRRLLDEDFSNYVGATGRGDASGREVAELLSGKSQTLVEFARGIQEDLVILEGDPGEGHPILAGVVCFPSGWSIADKLGKPIDAVHSPVPEYAEVMRKATNRILGSLKPDRPVWRTNWGLRPSGLLDQSPKRAPELIDAVRCLSAENIGEECHFRVERQTLSLLPRSGDILFTIHTYQCRVCELEPWQRQNLLGVLRTCPEKTLKYKGITPFFELLCRDLESDTGELNKP